MPRGRVAQYSIRNNKLEWTWGKLSAHSMLLGPWLIKEGYCGKKDSAQYNMINIIEVMQMVRHRGALLRETIVNGYFSSN